MKLNEIMEKTYEDDYKKNNIYSLIADTTEVIMMNNELHDVTFKIRYPSKKEKIIYAVKSILIDELNILVQSIITAATLCFLAENGWSISQKNNVLIVLLFVVFFISQILMCLRVLTGKYTLKEIIIREVKE